MTTLPQGCRTPNRCSATIHVCDPEPGSDAWLADVLGDAAMSAAPTVDDLAEDLEWIVGLIRVFFDCRRFRAQADHSDIQRTLDNAWCDLLTVISRARLP